MSRHLFRNGTVVNASGRVTAEVLTEDGVIVAIGQELHVDDAQVVDLSGKFLLPGGVDVHTHLDAPVGGTTTADDFYSGTVAAACGGTTTIVDFATQQPGQKLPDTVAAWHEKAAGKAVIDYGFHVSVTDLYKDAVADLGSVVGDGVTSFKVFMAYPGTLMMDDGELYRVLQAGGRYGATVCVHAESGTIIDRIAEDLYNDGKTGPRSHMLSRPPAVEVEAVERGIRIARMAEAPIYFVHLSTQGATEAVAEARLNNWPVAGETCTHYLTLTEEKYDAPGFEAGGAVLTPPLRNQDHQNALWRGLNNGSLGVVSSDHCPFCMAQKAVGKDDFRTIPNGGPGIEHRLQLMYGQGVRGGRISLERFVDLTATTPAASFGLAPRKGSIVVGADADLVVLDPEGITTITAAASSQKVDYSLWEGVTVPGRIVDVYARGERIVENGAFVGEAGRGSFLSRSRV